MTENASGAKQVFSSAGTLLREEDRNGNRTTYAYTGGRLTSLTDTQGRAVTVARNADGTVASITDSTGRQVGYTYDASLNLKQFTDAGGKKVGFTYSLGTNNLTEIKDAENKKTTIAYDASRRVTSIKRANNAMTTFAYSAGSTTVTDPRGKTTTYTYDGENRVTRVVDPRGKATSISYTANSDVGSIVTPNNQGTGRTLAATYDSLNNLTRVGKPAGQESSIAHAAPGFPYLASSATDAQNVTTNFGYDPRGNVASISGGTAAENQSTLTYNPNGTLHTSTDALGQATGFGYDAQGNLISIDRVAPLGDEAFGYDALSRLTSFTDGKGQTTTYTYDALDRRTKTTAADGSTTTYTFDGNGNRKSRKDSPGKSTNYTYDSVNQLTNEAVLGQTGTSYDYDLAGNVTSLTDQGGEVEYEYGPGGLLDALVEPGGARTTFAYDDNGNRTSTTYPNGVIMTEAWTPSDQIERVATNSPARSFVYSYIGPMGNNVELRQRIDATGPLGTSYTYRYDALGRLSQATAAGNDTTYAYDKNSNLIDKAVLAGGQSVNTHYTVGAANRLMSFATTATPPGGPLPSASYSYDANGNEVGGSRTWGFNARNQATTAPATPSGGTLAQTFLGEGQAERVSEGATTFRYNRLGLSSRTDALGTTYVTRDNDGRVISERSGTGAHRYYTFDGLGSTVSLTDASGNETSSYSYDPFGNRVAGAGSAEAMFQFAGGYRMPSGLYHFGARYYDPVIGRFTQQDPLDQIADLRQGNRYLYAGNDPINLLDPRGTDVLGIGHFLSKHKRTIITGLHVAYIAASGSAAGVGCAESALILCPAIVAGTVAADKYAEGVFFKGSYLEPEE